MPVNEVPDALFPTDNEWDIPTLFLPLQADFVDLPVRGWGSIKRKTMMRGTWHFYVDDYKFAAIWKLPDVVRNTSAVSVVEVNFTTEDQMPMAVGLYRTMQKRWLARYWQSQGLRVFVDLNVAKKFDEINLLGGYYGEDLHAGNYGKTSTGQWQAFDPGAIQPKVPGFTYK